MSPEQAQAAELLGQGWTQRDAAREVKVWPNTISRWLNADDPTFRQAVEATRARVLDENPTDAAIIEAAKTATDRHGRPDWRTRLRAVELSLGHRALLSDAADEPETEIDFDALAALEDDA